MMIAAGEFDDAWHVREELLRAWAKLEQPQFDDFAPVTPSADVVRFGSMTAEDLEEAAKTGVSILQLIAELEQNFRERGSDL